MVLGLEGSCCPRAGEQVVVRSVFGCFDLFCGFWREVVFLGLQVSMLFSSVCKRNSVRDTRVQNKRQGGSLGCLLMLFLFMILSLQLAA